MSSLDSKIAANKSKNESTENELQELEKGFGLILSGNTVFDEGDGFQAHLIFQPVHRYIKTIPNTKYISEWKSKGLSDGSIKSPAKSSSSLTPLIDYYGYKIRLKFNGSCLKQPKVSYTHEKTVNIYIVYQLAGSSSHSDDPTLKNCLFGAVTLTEKVDVDNCGYSGYGIGIDTKCSLSFPDGGFGQNVLILEQIWVLLFMLIIIDNKRRHISSLKKTTSRTRTYINRRRNVFS